MLKVQNSPNDTVSVDKSGASLFRNSRQHVDASKSNTNELVRIELTRNGSLSNSQINLPKKQWDEGPQIFSPSTVKDRESLIVLSADKESPTDHL